MKAEGEDKFPIFHEQPVIMINAMNVDTVRAHSFSTKKFRCHDAVRHAPSGDVSVRQCSVTSRRSLRSQAPKARVIWILPRGLAPPTFAPNLPASGCVMIRRPSKSHRRREAARQPCPNSREAGPWSASRRSRWKTSRMSTACHCLHSLCTVPLLRFTWRITSTPRSLLKWGQVRLCKPCLPFTPGLYNRIDKIRMKGEASESIRHSSRPVIWCITGHAKRRQNPCQTRRGVWSR